MPRPLHLIVGRPTLSSSRSTRFLRLVDILNPLTDSEDMTIRVTHVHLADAPWHVGRRPRDVETLLAAVPMDGVDIVHPDRHPDTLVGRLVAVGTEGHLHTTVATAALGALTQEDLAPAGANAPEGGRLAPVPSFLPPE